MSFIAGLNAAALGLTVKLHSRECECECLATVERARGAASLPFAEVLIRQPVRIPLVRIKVKKR